MYVVPSYARSKWWRRSRLFALLVKISLDDEMALIKRIAEIGPADTVLDLACILGLMPAAAEEIVETWG